MNAITQCIHRMNAHSYSFVRPSNVVASWQSFSLSISPCNHPVSQLYTRGAQSFWAFSALESRRQKIAYIFSFGLITCKGVGLDEPERRYGTNNTFPERSGTSEFTSIVYTTARGPEIAGSGILMAGSGLRVVRSASLSYSHTAIH